MNLTRFRFIMANPEDAVRDVALVDELVRFASRTGHGDEVEVVLQTAIEEIGVGRPLYDWLRSVPTRPSRLRLAYHLANYEQWLPFPTYGDPNQPVWFYNMALCWSPEVDRLLAADFAERAAWNWSSWMGGDDRLVRALDVARKYALGHATDPDLDVEIMEAWDQVSSLRPLAVNYTAYNALEATLSTLRVVPGERIALSGSAAVYAQDSEGDIRNFSRERRQRAVRAEAEWQRGRLLEYIFGLTEYGLSLCEDVEYPSSASSSDTGQM